jgi:ribosomal protein L4
MKTKPLSEKVKTVDNQSSISVSSRTVCEDEACIGKTVIGESASAQKPAEISEKRGEESGSSMSFGGKQGCTDEACIGKS